MCSFSLFNEEEVGVGGEQRTREGEADPSRAWAGQGWDLALVAGSPRQGKGCSALVESRGALGLDSEASCLCAQAPVMAIGLFHGPCDKRPHPPGELCSFSAFLRRLWWEGGVSPSGGDVGRKVWARVRLSQAGGLGHHCQLERGNRRFFGWYRPARVPLSQGQRSGSRACVDGGGGVIP